MKIGQLLFFCDFKSTEAGNCCKRSGYIGFISSIYSSGSGFISAFKTTLPRIVLVGTYKTAFPPFTLFSAFPPFILFSAFPFPRFTLTPSNDRLSDDIFDNLLLIAWGTVRNIVGG